jgi:hypothetical protein
MVISTRLGKVVTSLYLFGTVVLLAVRQIPDLKLPYKVSALLSYFPWGDSRERLEQPYL